MGAQKRASRAHWANRDSPRLIQPSLNLPAVGMNWMRRYLTPALLTILTLSPRLFALSDPEHGSGTTPAATGAVSAVAAADPDMAADTVPGFLPPLPSAPRGKSTVIGGVIRDVDPVRDQMTLKVYGGGRPMKILFDERTQFYRDGLKKPLSDLHPEEHASVETILDGDNVFAVSVHMLSHTAQGECQGQVLAFDPRNGTLTVRNTLSGEPIQLRVEPQTTIARMGQPAFASAQTGTSDLMRGALISVKFESNNGGGVADEISILATPGSGFYFSGDVTFLDLHAGLIALTDPRDQRSYTIAFDPSRFPASRELHEGSHVSVNASFDGSRYVASKLNVY
jgi:hypothetical protein